MEFIEHTIAKKCYLLVDPSLQIPNKIELVRPQHRLPRKIQRQVDSSHFHPPSLFVHHVAKNIEEDW